MWQELIKNINGLIVAYQMLYSLNEEKRQVILAIDMEKLSAIVEREKKLMKQVMELEQQRQKILLPLAGDKRINKASDLLLLCPAEQKDAFNKANEQLSLLVEKTTKINENNMMLLQGALTAVNINLNKLTGIQAQPDYGKNGVQEFSQQKREYDFKA